MSRFTTLRRVGLSKTDVSCYACLIEHGPATTRQLSKRLKLSQTNLYGTLTKLTEEGFIKKHKMSTKPALFTARPLNQALREHYMYQRRLVLPLCTELGLPPPPVPPPALHRGNA